MRAIEFNVKSQAVLRNDELITVKMLIAITAKGLLITRGRDGSYLSTFFHYIHFGMKIQPKFHFLQKKFTPQDFFDTKLQMFFLYRQFLLFILLLI